MILTKRALTPFQLNLSELRADPDSNRVILLSFDLDQRTGWPEELRVLLKQYPRDTWSANTSPLAQFWLEKHGMFRRQCEALQATNDEYRAERIGPQDFAVWAAPRLQTFIAHLHGHHQIEDYHYFPSFRASEPRLARGFETLEKDHLTLNAAIADVITAINELIATLHEKGDVPHLSDTQRHAGHRYVESSSLLYRRLSRHLDDEEDLIIPLMLDRG
jgi:hemerythrin-like domain-containing protein